MEKRKTIELAAQMRSVAGKGVRHLRRQGLVPAHVYGHGESSLAVQMNAKDLQSVLNRAGQNALLSLLIDGGTRSVIVRGVSRDPLSGAIIHADLQEVALDERLKATVPIVLAGEAPAAKGDAVVTRVLDHVNVEGLPGSLPGSLHLDISSLTDPDSTLHVRDLAVPEGVTLLTDPDEVVVRITAAAPLEEEAPAEAEEAAEPAAEEGQEAEAQEEQGA